MPTFLATLPGQWLPLFVFKIFISVLSSIIFLSLDFLDCVLCLFYKLVDEFFEGKCSSNPCYCNNGKEDEKGRKGDCIIDDDKESELSETLHGRKNIFREMGFLSLGKGMQRNRENCYDSMQVVEEKNRWSDCGCESCASWMCNGGQRLHVVVKELYSIAVAEDCKDKPTQNVIFVHGFLSSSSFWTETVFANLSQHTKQNYRLFAVDLLGFGRSPKPRHCLYTLRDHLDMIKKSVIAPFELNCFHLVAHSMGCIIGLALAAKYPKSVNSITLIAPPYLPSSREDASLTALNRLARRSLWPPLLFGSSFMSWYEHLGRCVCFLVCRNHRLWERILKLLTRKRELHFLIIDLTRHTHHSAWHTMHNVICGGAKLMDDYLETLAKNRVEISVIQGSRDQVVPLECSNNIKMKVPYAKVQIIRNADHKTIILGREKSFTRDLEHTWGSVETETE